MAHPERILSVVTPQSQGQISSRRLGLRYERLFLLGSGGMASVHLALAVGPKGFNRLVVVKSMHAELSAQEETRRMFLAEARLSARLNHPNVLQVSEVVEAPEGILLVMEYLEGLALSQVLRAGYEEFTLAMRVRTICEVLAGLHYAHELADYDGKPLGIVHRDVSPQNVIITYDGRVKLLDFGIAKATNSEHTQAGVIKGRIAYMPAEQLTGGRVDRRTDVYAMGCLLWETVAGSRLWANQSEREILSNVIYGRLPALSSRVQVDPELEAIVTRATALEPSERYPDAESMRAALEQYLSRLPGPVTARDIGDMLSAVSAEAREERQRAIAEAITKVDLSPPASGELLVEASSSDRLRPSPAFRGSGTMLSVQFGTPREAGPPSSRSAPGQELSLTQGDGRHTDTRSSVRVTPARRRPTGMLLAGLVALVACVALVLLWRQRASVEQPVAPAAPAAASVIEQRTLSVDASPRDARVLIDGQVMGENPAHLNVPPGSEHVVRVEREGYQPNERRVRVDENLAMNVALSAVESPPPAAPASASKSEGRAPAGRVTRRAPRAQPEAPKPAATPPREVVKDCSPPFYFKDGIKTYKPGCI